MDTESCIIIFKLQGLQVNALKNNEAFKIDYNEGFFRSFNENQLRNKQAEFLNSLVVFQQPVDNYARPL